MKNYKIWVEALVAFIGAFIITFVLTSKASASCCAPPYTDLERALQDVLRPEGDTTAINALWNAYPLREVTQVKRQLSDNSKLSELDLKSYLFHWKTFSKVKPEALKIKQLEWDGAKQIQTIIVIIQP